MEPKNAAKTPARDVAGFERRFGRIVLLGGGGAAALAIGAGLYLVAQAGPQFDIDVQTPDKAQAAAPLLGALKRLEASYAPRPRGSLAAGDGRAIVVRHRGLLPVNWTDGLVSLAAFAEDADALASSDPPLVESPTMDTPTLPAVSGFADDGQTAGQAFGAFEAAGGSGAEGFAGLGGFGAGGGSGGFGAPDPDGVAALGAASPPAAADNALAQQGLEPLQEAPALGGAVPEPATWLSLIVGFGLVGTKLRGVRGQAQLLATALRARSRALTVVSRLGCCLGMRFQASKAATL